jgi:AraC-like DNA-binding protein
MLRTWSFPSHLIILLPDQVYGMCECDTGDRIDRFRPTAPDTVIFNPAHTYLHVRIQGCPNQWRMLLLTIEPDVLSELGEHDLDQLKEKHCSKIDADDPSTRHTLVLIQEEIEKPSLRKSVLEERLLVLLLARLLTQSKRIAQPTHYVKGGLTEWRLKRALQLIENSFHKAPTLSEIAKAVELQETSFCRAFKQSTGQTPHHYLLVHRVNRAKEMMMGSNRTLTDIAFDCGFSSPSQFSITLQADRRDHSPDLSPIPLAKRMSARRVGGSFTVYQSEEKPPPDNSLLEWHSNY